MEQFWVNIFLHPSLSSLVGFGSGVDKVRRRGMDEQQHGRNELVILVLPDGSLELVLLVLPDGSLELFLLVHPDGSLELVLLVHQNTFLLILIVNFVEIRIRITGDIVVGQLGSDKRSKLM